MHTDRPVAVETKFALHMLRQLEVEGHMWTLFTVRRGEGQLEFVGIAQRAARAPMPVVQIVTLPEGEGAP